MIKRFKDIWSSFRFELDDLFHLWRGNRTQLEMFDFVFNENGYTCEEVRQSGDHYCSTLEKCFLLSEDLFGGFRKTMVGGVFEDSLYILNYQ